MLTYVLAADGSPLMPTYNIKKVRQMLKSGRAVIAGPSERLRYLAHMVAGQRSCCLQKRMYLKW